MWLSNELNGKSKNFNCFCIFMHGLVILILQFTVYVFVFSQICINACILSHYVWFPCTEIIFFINFLIFCMYNNQIHCLVADCDFFGLKALCIWCALHSFFPMFVMLYGNCFVTMFLFFALFNLTLCTIIIWRWLCFVVVIHYFRHPYCWYMVSFLYCYRICFSWWRLLTIIILTF